MRVLIIELDGLKMHRIYFFFINVISSEELNSTGYSNVCLLLAPVLVLSMGVALPVCGKLGSGWAACGWCWCSLSKYDSISSKSAFSYLALPLDVLSHSLPLSSACAAAAAAAVGIIGGVASLPFGGFGGLVWREVGRSAVGGTSLVSATTEGSSVRG